MPTGNASVHEAGTKHDPIQGETVSPAEPRPIALNCCLDCGEVRFGRTGFCSHCGQRDSASVIYVPMHWATQTEHGIEEVSTILDSDEAVQRPYHALDRIMVEVSTLILRIGRVQTSPTSIEGMWEEPEPTDLDCCVGCGEARHGETSSCGSCGRRKTARVTYVPEVRAQRAEACVREVDAILASDEASLEPATALDRIKVALYEFRHPSAPGARRS